MVIKKKNQIKFFYSKLTNKQKYIFFSILGLLVAIIVLLFIFIPKESIPPIIKVTNETINTDTETDLSTSDVDLNNSVELIENETTIVNVTTNKSSEESSSSSGGSSSGGSSSGGSSGGSSDNSDDENKDEPEETWPKCANWFGNNLDWDEITVATPVGDSGPWGLMNNNECTEKLIDNQGEYGCAVAFEEGGFGPCIEDCKDGICLPCDGCGEIVSVFACFDELDNDADGKVDCKDEDCDTLICAENSYCENNECVEEIEECTYTDSDGGDDRFVAGTCDDGKAFLNTDYCDGNILIEYWLGEGDACYDGCQGENVLFNCESLGNGWSCNAGACTLGDGSCQFTDSDGGWTLDVKGTCDDGQAIQKTDYCESVRGIQEYQLNPTEPCQNGCIKNLYPFCPFICEDGACVEKTTETSNQQCATSCTISRSSIYKTGICIDYNEDGAISKEQTCVNNDYLDYETDSEGTCRPNEVCCCVEEMLLA